MFVSTGKVGVCVLPPPSIPVPPLRMRKNTCHENSRMGILLVLNSRSALLNAFA